MTILLKTISFIGLLMTIIPSFFLFINKIDISDNYLLMAIGTLIWFVSAPFWMNKKSK